MNGDDVNDSFRHILLNLINDWSNYYGLKTSCFYSTILTVINIHSFYKYFEVSVGYINSERFLSAYEFLWHGST